MWKKVFLRSKTSYTSYWKLYIQSLFSLSVSPVSGERHSFSVSVPHRVYECPEGSNVTLTCVQSGSKTFSEDKLWNTWLFTPHSQEHCHKGIHPRGSSHSNRTMGVQYIEDSKSFSVILQNIKHKDQGKYCCLLLEVHTKQKVEQGAHEFIYLNVVPCKWARREVGCDVIVFSLFVCDLNMSHFHSDSTYSQQQSEVFGVVAQSFRWYIQHHTQIIQWL